MSKRKPIQDPFFEREALKYGKPIPSREFIIQYLEELGVPERYSRMVVALKLKTVDDRVALRRRLNAMVRDGQLLTDRRGRYALVNQMDMVRGYVICHRDGYGFLVPDDGSSDLFLSPKQIRGLFPGDRVLAHVVMQKEQGKREGIVVEVLERNFTHLIGRYLVEGGVHFVIPVNRNISQEIVIPRGERAGATPGALVDVELISYPTSRVGATGRVDKILGGELTPDLEMEVAIGAHGLPYEWPLEVLAESKALAKLKVDAKGRKDLRKLPFVTIDGDDAKDFDDAVYAEKHPDQSWTLYVAIADVSQYVAAGSDLDHEAFKRGNSVYFPNGVVPMLPEVLSNGLCSLKPKVARWVLVCEAVLSKSGEIKSYHFYEATIRSHARLTYDGVFALLEGQAEDLQGLLPYLLQLRELYQILLRQRQVRGSLDFSQVESKIVFNRQGDVKGIKPVEHHYVHNIIEECMLVANVCASQLLLKHRIPALYRIHEGPDSEKLKNLRIFLEGMGLTLGGGNKPKSGHYAELLREISGRAEAHLVQIVLLRSLKQAVYAPVNVGHFGLAYDEYTHFTSPIRRYPDLINHRAIKYLLAGGKVDEYYYNQDAMRDFGNHCSLTERRADDASGDVVLWCKCQFMKHKVGKVFDGIVAGVANCGIFVELTEVLVSGLVHVTSLKNDYYQLDLPHQRLVGRRTGTTYRLGDRVKVRVMQVDVDNSEIVLGLVK